MTEQGISKLLRYQEKQNASLEQGVVKGLVRDLLMWHAERSGGPYFTSDPLHTPQSNFYFRQKGTDWTWKQWAPKETSHIVNKHYNLHFTWI